MTFKQALELNAHIRKDEHGSLVVYADKIIRTETDTDTDEDRTRKPESIGMSLRKSVTAAYKQDCRRMRGN